MYYGSRYYSFNLLRTWSVIYLQMILHWGAQLNFMFSLLELELDTKSLCVLKLQNSVLSLNFVSAANCKFCRARP